MKSFAERLLSDGKVLDRYETECDNGHLEAIRVLHTNGICFVVAKLNGIVINVG